MAGTHLNEKNITGDQIDGRDDNKSFLMVNDDYNFVPAIRNLEKAFYCNSSKVACNCKLRFVF